MNRARVLALVLILLAGLGLATTPHAAAAGCALDRAPTDTWSKVRVTPTTVVAQDDTNPCLVLAISPDRVQQTSSDGGATWRTSTTQAPAAPTSLVTSLAGARGVFLLADSGLWFSTDWGTHWTRSIGLTGQLVHLSISPQDVKVSFAVTSSGTGALASTRGWVSRNRGASFAELTAASALSPTAIAADAANPREIWLTTMQTGTGGLYLSRDTGQTFSASIPMRDALTLQTALDSSGGALAMIGTRLNGFVVVTDDGASAEFTGGKVTADELWLEARHPSNSLAITENVASRTITRTPDYGVSDDETIDGLPTNCSPRDLRGASDSPSTYLVTCTDGTTFRYRSDGTDLGDEAAPGGGAAPLPTAPAVTSSPGAYPNAPVLVKHPVPFNGESRDGSLAFDGTYLYYANFDDPKGTLHRMVAATGADAGVVSTGVDAPLLLLAYDANQHRMFLEDDYNRVFVFDLITKQRRFLFDSPQAHPPDTASNAAPGGGSLSYDAQTERLLLSFDNDNGFSQYSTDGELLESCETGRGVTASVGPRDVYISGLVATGNGQVLVQEEDDQTFAQLSSSCRIRGRLHHTSVDEAEQENDQLACDTQTFPVPAVWIRDALGHGLITAYRVDGAYCALPTTTTLVRAPAGTLCADVKRTGDGLVLPGQTMRFLVDNVPTGKGTTDARGRACIPYASRGTATHLVTGFFQGTVAYRTSSAKTSLAALQIPPTGADGQQQRTGQDSAVAGQPPAPPGGAPAVALQAAPAPAPAPAPGAQPGAQPGGQPGGQAGGQAAANVGTQGQLGVSPQRDSPEIAAGAEGGTGPLLRTPAWMGLTAGTLLAGFVARRRRRWRVVPQAA